MYSSKPGLSQAERDAGYECEDWCNNDLGVARGWWTPGYEDEPEEKHSALRTALRAPPRPPGAASTDGRTIAGCALAVVGGVPSARLPSLGPT